MKTILVIQGGRAQAGAADGHGDAQAVRRVVGVRRADGGNAHGGRPSRAPGHPGVQAGHRGRETV